MSNGPLHSLFQLLANACMAVSYEDGDRRACVRLGIIIGENRERRASWRREHPEVFFYER
jgi:hypothetical protein